MKAFVSRSLALALWAICALPNASLAQSTQTTLAQEVLSEDYRVRSRAVVAASRLDPAEVDQALRAALFTALIREASIHRQQFEAGQRNERLRSLESPEHVFFLAEAVIRLKDPASIQSLASALFTGTAVPNAISQFGEQAVPVVLEVVTTEDTWHDLVSGALIALRFIVESEGLENLSPHTLQEVRAATTRLLSSQVYFPVLWRAIDLAAVLDDPGLTKILSTLATDAGAITARGVVATDLIEQTRQRARDRLSGIPPRRGRARAKTGSVSGDRMPSVGVLLMASLVTIQADNTVLLGLVERDLTGDGVPEVLRVVGVGPPGGPLDVTFTIESEGRTVYRYELEPLGRTLGFDAGRRVLSPEERRTRIREFGKWFFAESKFQRPEEFVESLQEAGARMVGEIPNAIARDREASDTVPGDVIWREIRNAPVTIFTFSPGGDTIVALGWSERARRFYRLLECC